jgi:tetratricopeptide (TPR) repeat protein
MQAEETNDRTQIASVPNAAAAQSFPAETQPEFSSASVAGASVVGTSVVGESVAKHCCICGLDVTHKPRSKDSKGRYWCVFCLKFLPSGEPPQGSVPCPDCARPTRPHLMVDQSGIKVCTPCNQLHLAEAAPRKKHKEAATANPETEIRLLIRQLLFGIGGCVAAGLLLTLYHYGLLYVKPMSWVPFESVLYLLAIAAGGLAVAIASQYGRIAYRQRMREVAYDDMIRAAANQILAVEDENHASGISESSEPLRRRVERAIARVEACAGLGVKGAGEVLAELDKRTGVEPLIHFLMSLRPETADTVARNREIATISYLHGDFAAASAAVSSILLRLHHDQEAMTRQALICFKTGDLEQAKKIFKRVVYTAKEKNNELDLAEAYTNLGMLHLLLSEFDDAGVRYSQAMQIYQRLSKEEGQADCLLNLALIAYKKKNKGPEVEDQFRQAMAINKRHKRLEGLSTCCGLLGVILIEKEPAELREAEKLLTQAVKLNMELGRPGGVAAAYGNLGLVRAKRGDFKGARENLLKAQSVYQRINRPKMMAKIQEMLKTVGTISAARGG